MYANRKKKHDRKSTWQLQVNALLRKRTNVVCGDISRWLNSLYYWIMFRINEWSDLMFVTHCCYVTYNIYCIFILTKNSQNLCKFRTPCNAMRQRSTIRLINSRCVWILNVIQWQKLNNSNVGHTYTVNSVSYSDSRLTVLSNVKSN